jgi:choline dehydrogenase-like flavoprotein
MPGVYQTPKILELSGIGKQDVLKQLGVPVLQNLPGVGENLQDHIAVTTHFEVKPEAGPSLDWLTTNKTYGDQQWTNYINNRTGPYGSIPGPTVAFFPLKAIFSADKIASLKAGLDKELAQYKGTPFEAQYASQRKQLDDENVAQIELIITPCEYCGYFLLRVAD